jgi:hypothetical protein
VLSFRQDPDNTTHLVQADPLIELPDHIVANLARPDDGAWVTFHTVEGDVTYVLEDHDDIRETWIGIRSDIDSDDLG